MNSLNSFIEVFGYFCGIYMFWSVFHMHVHSEIMCRVLSVVKWGLQNIARTLPCWIHVATLLLVHNVFWRINCCNFKLIFDFLGLKGQFIPCILRFATDPEFRVFQERKTTTTTTTITSTKISGAFRGFFFDRLKRRKLIRQLTKKNEDDLIP